MWKEFEDTKGVIQNSYIEEEQTTQWPKDRSYMQSHNNIFSC
jgi:hypothetical protein